MNIRFSFCCFLLCGLLAGGLPGHAEPATVDPDWHRLAVAVEACEKITADAKGGGSGEALVKARADITDLAVRLILKHPHDARRDEAVEALFTYFGFRGVEPDVARALLPALPHLSIERKELLESYVIAPRMKEIKAQAKKDAAGAVVAERRVIDDLLARYPNGQLAARYVPAHLKQLGMLAPERAEETARLFIGKGNPAVAEASEAWLTTHKARSHPLDLSFTAIDGREVNLAKLRGKVVIVEFTGVTWCPYCRVAEVELKKLYDKYHHQGFEIVAITYEFKPEDRPKVEKLIKERDLPWPFYFDGLKDKNPHVRRFGIGAFPTTFVLGRDGRIAANNPSLSKLEALIEQLLESSSSGEAQQETSLSSDWAALEKAVRSNEAALQQAFDAARTARQGFRPTDDVLATGRELVGLATAFALNYPQTEQARKAANYLANVQMLFEDDPSFDASGGQRVSASVAGLPAETRVKLEVPAERRRVAKLVALPDASVAIDRAVEHLVEFERRFPEAGAVVGIAIAYAESFERREGSSRLAFVRALARVSAPKVSGYARGLLAIEDARARPLDLRVTAIDGRPIDLAALRGKVVLIDFWATWCAPCVAELPHVKRVYQQYQSAGFEVIGVALESIRLAPTDGPDEIAAKTEKVRKALTDYVTQKALPWPQYLNMRVGGQDLASRFSVTTIPAMFLLDQEGRLVATDARGEKLEAEVKRLLRI